MDYAKFEQIKERMNIWFLGEKDPDRFCPGLIQAILDIKASANDMPYLIELVEKQDKALYYLAGKIIENYCFACERNNCKGCQHESPASIENLVELAMNQTAKDKE